MFFDLQQEKKPVNTQESDTPVDKKQSNIYKS